MNYDPIHDTYSAEQLQPPHAATDTPLLSQPPPAAKPHSTPLTGPLLEALPSEEAEQVNGERDNGTSGPSEANRTIKTIGTTGTIGTNATSGANGINDINGPIVTTGPNATNGPYGSNVLNGTAATVTQWPVDLEPGQLPPDFRQISRGFKHLKKSDGEPFWRKDIQFDFLHELFADETKCFTNTFPFCEFVNCANGPKLTFSELYVRTLAESSKSSKVLRERLIKDVDMGVAVSKVCLLVNAGRMNTTVNFVPDMRLALRTYHSIPSLQKDATSELRPLQDTPRLKTILKAVCDGQDHLQTLLDLLREPPAEKPNTNVIKLIFLMSSFFQNIPFHYDDSFDHESFSDKLRFIKASPGPQNKFMEFFLNDEIDPKNRAQRFLWLMYTYLETLFTREEMTANPFGGLKIPPLEYIPESEIAKHDIDLDYEVDYAVKMYHTRMMHLREDISGTGLRKYVKPKRERSKQRKLPEEARGEEDIDDLMVVDETVAEEESAEETEQAEEQPKQNNSTPKPNGDRAKRKKPTPSVGSLVDENKKPLDAELRWTNPEFPISRLSKVKGKYAYCTKGIEVQPLTRDSATSAAKRRLVVTKTKSYVAQIAKSTPNFTARRAEYLQWMNRYFQYKKATGNGLLGMEWEDLRSDVVNGVEAYLYQQKGKMLVNHHYDEQMEDERHENGEPELLKRENFVTGQDILPGDSAPVDIGSIDKVGSGFVAVHDFDHANERTNYEHLLLTLVDDLIRQNGLMRQKSSCAVKFDLENGTMSLQQ